MLRQLVRQRYIRFRRSNFLGNSDDVLQIANGRIRTYDQSSAVVLVMGNLILFGAGASFGSDDPRAVPPLGGNLYDALCGFNPTGWGAVADGLARQFKDDFEQGMKSFAKVNPTSVDVLQRAMAAYFFQFQPRPSSLYSRLARRLQACNWTGALASLNYERLLELAIRSTGTNVHIGSPSQSGGDIELCLPHGCCHLFGQIKAVGNIDFGGGIRFDGPRIRVIEKPEEHERELRESTVPPIMSYFQPDKQTRAGVSFINQQRKRCAKLVLSAQTVAIIGVKVRAHDAHIWDPLAQSPARLVYCAGAEGAKKFECWAAKCGRKNDRVIRAYWADGFDEICEAIMS